MNDEAAECARRERRGVAAERVAGAGNRCGGSRRRRKDGGGAMVRLGRAGGSIIGAAQRGARRPAAAATAAMAMLDGGDGPFEVGAGWCRGGDPATDGPRPGAADCRLQTNWCCTSARAAWPPSGPRVRCAPTHLPVMQRRHCDDSQRAFPPASCNPDMGPRESLKASHPSEVERHP